MPSLDERLRLAEAAMIGLAGDAQLPPKVALHPRPTDAFAHAMPAFMPGSDPSGADDMLGMKWVAGFPGNGAVGLPAISALVLLDDPADRVPGRHPRRHADHRTAHGGRLGRGHRRRSPHGWRAARCALRSSGRGCRVAAHLPVARPPPAGLCD